MTMVQPDAPPAPPQVRTVPAGPVTGTPVSRFRSTPGRLTVTLAALFALTLLFGTVAVTGAAQRNSAVARVRTTSGPLTVAAETLYRSLSDAEAAASAAFLSGGASEPPALRARYDNDIASASAALTAVSAGGGGTSGPKTRDALRDVAAGLPVFTGLVETARADNRLGLPVGAAYLREASSEMERTLLPAATALYAEQSDALTADEDAAAAFPWFATLLGIVLLVFLIRAQLMLTRRTRRVFNIGLVASTLAVVITLAWLLISWTAASVHLSAARDHGSRQVQDLSSARSYAQEARASEALTLIARGSGQADETNYAHLTAVIAGSGRNLLDQASDGATPATASGIDAARRDLAAWLATHKKIRSLDDAGAYPDAVAMAIGSGKTDAPALFAAVDNDLAAAIDAANARFVAESASAAGATRSTAITAGILTVLALACLAIGFQRRIAEYR